MPGHTVNTSKRGGGEENQETTEVLTLSEDCLPIHKFLIV